MAELPPGFVLDRAPAPGPAAPAPSSSALPPGFVLERPAPAQPAASPSLPPGFVLEEPAPTAPLPDILPPGTTQFPGQPLLQQRIPGGDFLWRDQAAREEALLANPTPEARNAIYAKWMELAQGRVGYDYDADMASPAPDPLKSFVNSGANAILSKAAGAFKYQPELTTLIPPLAATKYIGEQSGADMSWMEKPKGVVEDIAEKRRFISATHQYEPTILNKLAGGAGNAVVNLPELVIGGPPLAAAGGAITGAGGGTLEAHDRRARGETITPMQEEMLAVTNAGTEAVSEFIGGKATTKWIPGALNKLKLLEPLKRWGGAAVGQALAQPAEEMGAELMNNAATAQIVDQNKPGLTDNVLDAGISAVGGSGVHLPISIYMASQQAKERAATPATTPPQQAQAKAKQPAAELPPGFVLEKPAPVEAAPPTEQQAPKPPPAPPAEPLRPAQAPAPQSSEQLDALEKQARDALEGKPAGDIFDRIAGTQQQATNPGTTPQPPMPSPAQPAQATPPEPSAAQPSPPAGYGATPTPPDVSAPIIVEAYRGVPEGGDPAKPGVGGGRFFSPDPEVAKSYAGSGQVAKETLTFERLFTAPNWMKAKEQLGLPQAAGMADVIEAAGKAGHDGIVFERHNGKPEYVDLRESPQQPAAGTLPGDVSQQTPTQPVQEAQPAPVAEGLAQGQAGAQAPAASQDAAAVDPNEALDDKSRREFRENADRVARNPEAASFKDLWRARSYVEQKLRQLAGNPATPDETLRGLENEAQYYGLLIKQKEASSAKPAAKKKASQPPQPVQQPADAVPQQDQAPQQQAENKHPDGVAGAPGHEQNVPAAAPAQNLGRLSAEQPARSENDEGEARQARGVKTPQQRPDAAPDQTRREKYSNIHQSWVGQQLYDWGSAITLAKGKKAKGETGRQTRQFPTSAIHELERVHRDSTSLLKELRATTDEVWDVRGKAGGYFLAPKRAVAQAMEKLKAQGIDPETEVIDRRKGREERKAKLQQDRVERERRIGGVGDELVRQFVIQTDRAPNATTEAAFQKPGDPKRHGTLRDALAWAKEQPEDSTGYALGYIFEHAKKDRPGTMYQWVQPANLQDGTEILVGDEKFTVEHDPDTAEVLLHDGITVKVDEYTKVPAREVREGEMAAVPEGDPFADVRDMQKPDEQRRGIFGQEVFDAATGNQQGGLFHEPTQVEGPTRTGKDAKIARKFDEKATPAMFGEKPASQPPEPAQGPPISPPDAPDQLPDKPVIDEQAEAVEVSEQQAKSSAMMETAKTSHIEDFGEKIGGARKDLAVKTGPRPKSDEPKQPARPAWARHYKVSENASKTRGKPFFIRRGEKLVFRNGRLAEYDTKEQAEAALPQIVAEQQHTIRQVKADDGTVTFGIHRKVSDRKRPLVKGGFGTHAEAEQYLRDNPEELLSHEFKFPEKPWLERIERVGPSRRTGNIAPKDFQETFRFRGGEFGNWNRGEGGQQALNHAYDALYDLADALGIPPSGVSLNGQLAIAFGARGHGGKESARAHYEPDKRVINLTKIKGAGALAHEWFHGLDHYLHTRSRSNDAKDESGHVSDGMPYKHSASPELAAAIKGVIDTMISKQAEKAIDQTFEGKRNSTQEKYFQEAIGQIRADMTHDQSTYNKRWKKPTAEQLAEFDALAKKLVAGDVGEKRTIHSEHQRSFKSRSTYDVIEQISDLHKKITGRGINQMDENSRARRLYWQATALYDARKRLAAAEQGTKETKRVPTDYFDEARKIDEMRASDYWSTPHEMAARAFEAYIQDKIGATGRSDYLVYAAENKYYRLLEMSPYPEGEERTAINAAFDKLVEAIKQEKDRPTAGILDRVEAWAREQLKQIDENTDEALKKLTPKQRRRRGSAGSLDPQRVILYGVIGAAKIGKGAQRFTTWSKAMIADLGDKFTSLLKRDQAKVWREARRIHKMADGERANYVRDRMTIEPTETTGETVRRLTGQVNVSKAVSEVEALRMKLRAASKAGREGWAAAARQLDGLKNELVRTIRENLPTELHGQFLGNVAKVRTLSQLRYSVQKASELLADHDLRNALKSVESFTGTLKLDLPKKIRTPEISEAEAAEKLGARMVETLKKKETGDNIRRVDLATLPEPQRTEVKKLLAQAKAFKVRAKELIGHRGNVEEKQGLVDELERVEREIRQIAADVANDREVRVGQKLMQRDALVDEAIRAIDPEGESAVDGEFTTAPQKDTRIVQLVKRGHSSMETIAHLLFGEGSNAYKLFITNVREAQEGYQDEKRKAHAHLSGLLESAGIPPRTKRLSKWLTKRETVKLPDFGSLTATRSEMTMLYAAGGDPQTLALIDRGVEWTPKSDERRNGKAISIQDLETLKSILTPGERAISDGFKEYNEQVLTARAMEAKLHLSGWAPDAHPNYFPRARNRKQMEDKGLPTGWQGVRARQIENTSSMKERRPDLSQPLVINDFLEVVTNYFDDTARLIHMGEAVRDVAAVIEDKRFAKAIERKFGEGMNKRLQTFLEDTMLARVRPTSDWGTIAHEMAVHNVSRALLQLNPKTWGSNVFGGTFKLLPEFHTADLVAAVPKFFLSPAKTYREMTAESGVAWDRYEGQGLYSKYSILTETRTPPETNLTFLEAVSSGKLGAAIDAIPILKLADAVPFGVAWEASKLHVERTMPDASAEAKKEAQLRRFHDSTYATQNGTTSTEVSGMAAAAKRNRLWQWITLFKSDTNKSLGMLMRLRGKDNATKAKTIAAVSMNAVASAAIGYALKKALQEAGGAAGGAEDDEEQEERFFRNFLWDMAGNFAGMGYLGDQFLNIARAWKTHRDADFDGAVGRSAENAINDLAELLKATANYYDKRDTPDVDKAWQRLKRAGENELLSLSTIAGVPIAPLWRLGRTGLDAATFEPEDPRLKANREAEKAQAEKAKAIRNEIRPIDQALRERADLDRKGGPGDSLLTPEERERKHRVDGIARVYERQMKVIREGDEQAAARAKEWLRMTIEDPERMEYETELTALRRKKSIYDEANRLYKKGQQAEGQKLVKESGITQRDIDRLSRLEEVEKAIKMVEGAVMRGQSKPGTGKRQVQTLLSRYVKRKKAG